MGRNNADFAGGSNSLTPTVCKHCGTEISTNVATIRLDNGAIYLFPPKEKQEWYHPAVGEMVLNNAATLSELKRDPDWKHTPEPADGRTHEQDYERHVLETRMHNISKGIDPRESMELAMKPHTHTAYSIGKNGFGVV
jgi:hypothetical protein